MSNAPFILNVDCDMYSNNSQTLHHTMCFLLDPKESHRLAFVQYPQSFGGITQNDLYSTSLIRVIHVETYGQNGYDPAYYGTGAIHRRESLNGRKFTPDFQPKWEDKPLIGENESWSELEERAKAVTSCTYEHGKPWGKEMGLMYGCPVEDVFTGLALHSRGWQSVYFTPERKAFLGFAPRNTNDTLVMYKRWSTGLFVIFLSQLCPLTHGIGRMKWGQIMSYSFYTLWTPWSLPILCYSLLPLLAMTNGISLFPKVSDPWCKVFAFLGIASPAYSLGELLWINGTVKMWLNDTRMWMMRGVSSFLISMVVVILKVICISDSGFEITSKVIDEEALKRYKKEVMEFAVPSPMFVPLTVLSLLNLYCFLRSIVLMIIEGWPLIFDHMALQIMLSGFISLVSLPLYEAMFLRRDKGRMPTSITVYSIILTFALLHLISPLM